MLLRCSTSCIHAVVLRYSSGYIATAMRPVLSLAEHLPKKPEYTISYDQLLITFYTERAYLQVNTDFPLYCTSGYHDPNFQY